MSEVSLPNRLSGAVWGHLVGDAMGVPYEFRSADQVGEVRWGETGTHGQPPGTWSDDGALMLALLDSLVSVGFDTEDQGRRALAWRNDGAYAPGGKVFDIGNATSAALDAIEHGTPAQEAGPTHERSASNGSLMRILPLALWGKAKGLEAGELAGLATRASKVTHRHPACQVACATYTPLAWALLDDVKPSDALGMAIETLRVRFAPDGEAPDVALATAMEELADWRSNHEPAGRGGAMNAFWSAWIAFEGASSYAETIECAIRYGNDTDTTAAIAGGLAGIHWGISGIPAEWLAGMRDRPFINSLIDRLRGTH